MENGICFAGGGVKGAAHIGVIKALEEENMEFKYIGGTSSGSIVACLYACGFTADEMLDIFQKYCKKIKYVDFLNILKLIIGLIFTRTIIIDGLNSGRQIEKLINKFCSNKQIENISDIKKKLLIPSVNLCNGEVICFTSFMYNKRSTYSDNIIYNNNINIGKAVRASCSYPTVFSPCEFNNAKLIDGGIRENVPWKELEKIGAKKVLNITFETENNDDCNKNLIEVAGSSIGMLCQELSNYEMEGSDDVIKIKTKKTGLLDISKIKELYSLGYNEAKRNIMIIKKYK